MPSNSIPLANSIHPPCRGRTRAKVSAELQSARRKVMRKGLRSLKIREILMTLMPVNV